jgi:Zn-dependent protease with chaperone function
MTMTNPEFAALVQRLEEEARRDPRSYGRRVLALALLGNSYLAAVVALLVAILVLLFSFSIGRLIAAQLIFVLGAFLLLVLKSVWIKIEPPSGIQIKRREAPDLFAMIDELGQKLGSPRFHYVLVTDALNAGVVQITRLGIFGWPRNYLLIGLPLMKCLTVEQFKAVLGHEFGHLAKGHGRLSNWIYRQRLRWSRLMTLLDTRQSRGRWLFRSFLNWYAPYFNAYSFPLARANEYEADATSASLTSPKVAAQALTGVGVAAGYLQSCYWPQIHKQADGLPRPAFAPFAAMGSHLASDLGGEGSKPWLESALAGKSTVLNTHPALGDRLEAMGETAQFAPPQGGDDAAEKLLGNRLAPITQALDRRWEKAILPAWEERNRKVFKDKQRLIELDSAHACGYELSLREACERAALTESPGGDAEASLAQFRALYETAPAEAVVAVGLGARLLSRDDASGIALVERAMQSDPEFIAYGCEALRNFHLRAGREEEAAAWQTHLNEGLATLLAAKRAHATVRLNDKFIPHDLDADALARLRAQLRAVPGLRKAYLVKREARAGGALTYIVGFSVTEPLRLHLLRRGVDARKRIMDSAALPQVALVICVDGSNRRLGRKFFWMHGARIV